MSNEPVADFIVIGAMKCATSTVCAFLEDHPDVFMVEKCEPNYFSKDENFAQGRAWYASHFERGTSATIRGEGSNDYAARDMHPKSAERMAHYNSNLRLIFMVRHPLKRITSAWIQNRINMGNEIAPTLDQAVREMPMRFIGQSRYWYTFQGYREYFPDSQIFIGFMEDLNRDPETFWHELCSFLEISPKAAKREHVNPSKGKRVPGRAYSKINKMPLVKALKRFAPKSLKTVIKTRLLSQKADQVPDLSPDIRAEVLAVLEPEAEALLDYCGKPKDFWTF